MVGESVMRVAVVGSGALGAAVADELVRRPAGEVGLARFRRTLAWHIARRALLQAATEPRFEGRRITARFARTFLARDGAVLHDNPHALLLCVHRSGTVLCAREGTREVPALGRCVPG
ncbi:hypothetical protein SAMN05216371_8115 [Streptomyces sp. TLI_053]|uniref:hypothetical protein n=1 Tax=Streptomyces sp. TLI_053 TaxID=1855352 RepID=UPI00087A15A4|nr:hypothetical protein [Streptomyces sp. TLI_053]SDT83295.1 hypothetical protein SAMN05216371_8115 [Streptomyces sp. TLI_053]